MPFKGWNQIGHIADDKQITRIAIEYQRGIDTRIAAGNDQGLWCLAFFYELLVKTVVMLEMLLAEAAESLN
jgi:hypothetical protein